MIILPTNNHSIWHHAILYGAIFLLSSCSYFSTVPESSSISETPVSTSTAPSETVEPVSPISPIKTTETAAQTGQEIETGLRLYDNEQYEQALRIFEQVLEREPENYIALNARGSTHLALEDYNSALDDFTETIHLEPLFPHAYYNRGRAYTSLEQYEEALADFRQAAQFSPDEFGYRANGNMGLIYHRQGEYDNALEAFEQSISYDGSKADVYYFRGETFTAMEDYPAAIADYEAAIERFPEYDLAYQGLGYAYYKTGQLDQAREVLEQALEISPNSPTVFLYLTLVELAADNSNRAQELASQAAESITALPEEEREVVLTRGLADLETLAEANPDQVEIVEAIIELLPLPE